MSNEFEHDLRNKLNAALARAEAAEKESQRLLGDWKSGNRELADTSAKLAATEKERDEANRERSDVTTKAEALVLGLEAERDTLAAQVAERDAMVGAARDVMDKCRDRFSKIHGDWLDPRFDCREGWRLIDDYFADTATAAREHEARIVAPWANALEGVLACTLHPHDISGMNMIVKARALLAEKP
jgi:hypothetical protein